MLAVNSILPTCGMWILPWARATSSRYSGRKQVYTRSEFQSPDKMWEGVAGQWVFLLSCIVSSLDVHGVRREPAETRDDGSEMPRNRSQNRPPRLISSPSTSSRSMIHNLSASPSTELSAACLSAFSCHAGTYAEKADRSTTMTHFFGYASGSKAPHSARSEVVNHAASPLET
jgi:hypothetical protein